VTSTAFFTISSGRFHSCGLRLDDNTSSNVNCWGQGYFGETTPPADTFSQISAGANFTCGIKADDDSIVCWSANTGEYGAVYNQSMPPIGSFSQVSAGAGHSCAIRKTDHTVVCWGRNTNWDDTQVCGQANPPPLVPFSQVSAGWWHTCGIRENDNTIQCWGCPNTLLPTPSGTFKQVSANYGHTCAIKTDGTVECWGEESLLLPDNLKLVKFDQISAGFDHTCGVREDNDANGSNVACWGTSERAQTTLPAGIQVKPQSLYNPPVKPISGYPVAQFFFYPHRGDIQNGFPVGILFNGTDSYDTDPDSCCIKSYLWGIYDYQKLDMKFGRTYTHIFTKPGNYLIGLMVIDEKGNPSTSAITSISLE
jgi:hypothetical protein